MRVPHRLQPWLIRPCGNVAVGKLLLGVVMSTGRTAITLGAGAGLLVLVLGCGAVAGGVSQSGAPTPTRATSALSSETPLPPNDPGGPTRGGSALPVRPIMGCYLGL